WSPERGPSRWGRRTSTTPTRRSGSRTASGSSSGARGWPARPTSGPSSHRPMRPNPLIVAADLTDPAGAEALAERLSGLVAYVKVGLELFVAAGPAAVGRVARFAPVFLDLKLHDIPATVRGAARGAGRLGAGLLTVHA